MERIAIVVLADTDQSDSMGRIVNALMAAREYKEAGDDVQLIFTGTGTKWVAALSDPAHAAHGMYAAVKDRVAGACGFCAAAYGQTDAVESCGVPVLKEYGDNMSFRRLTQAGYQVLTF